MKTSDLPYSARKIERDDLKNELGDYADALVPKLLDRRFRGFQLVFHTVQQKIWLGYDSNQNYIYQLLSGILETDTTVHPHQFGLEDIIIPLEVKKGAEKIRDTLVEMEKEYDELIATAFEDEHLKHLPFEQKISVDDDLAAVCCGGFPEFTRKYMSILAEVEKLAKDFSTYLADLKDKRP